MIREPTHSLLPLLVGTLVAGACTATPLRGQSLPGMPGGQGGTVQMHMAEYYADVIGHVNQTIDGWRRAWSGDAADDLSRIYLDDAFLLFPGEDPTWGREAIRQVFSARLGSLGEAQLSLGDVKASGKMAYIGGRFFYEIQSGERAGERVSGYHVTVFFRVDGDWLIRTQVFRPSDEDSEEN